MDVLHLLQTHLLVNFKTGNQIIDTIIVGIIITNLTFILNFLKNKFNYFKEKILEKNINTFYIYSRVEKSSITGEPKYYINEIYYYVYIYLVNNCKNKNTDKGSFEIKGVEDTVNCFLYLKTISFENLDYKIHRPYIVFEGVKIYYEFKTNKINEEKNSIIFEYIKLYADKTSNNILENFITYIQNIEIQRNNENKYQKLYYYEKKCILSNKNIQHNFVNKENLILDKNIKEFLFNDVEKFLNSKELYNKLGINWNRGYLLYGPPGGGKTKFVKCLSNHFKMDIYYLDMSKINSEEELEFFMRNVKEKSIILTEDIDKLTDLVKKDDIVKIDKKDKDKDFKTILEPTLTLSHLLNYLDGVFTDSGKIFIWTTNHIEDLNPILLRPGRIDIKMEFGLCSIEQLNGFYNLFFEKQKLPDKITKKFKENKHTTAKISGLFNTHKYNEEELLKSLENLE